MTKYTVGEPPPPIDFCYTEDRGGDEEVSCDVEVHEQNDLNNEYQTYDLPSSIIQDHNDSIMIEGMHETKLIAQDMDDSTVETWKEGKRDRRHEDEEEYDEKKEKREIAKKRKASKGRGNNVKRVRMEYLQKKKKGDEDVPEQPNVEEIPAMPKRKYNKLWYTQNVDTLDTPRITSGIDRRKQQKQQPGRSLRNKQPKIDENINSDIV